MDDPDSDHEMTQVNQEDAQGSPYKDGKPGIYDFYGFITHLGASIHAGHYVCHLKQAGEQGKWVYFNDAKVALTSEPPIGKGYMYFFKKRND
jgi:ubiquitin carboxyl-terminal hydrolase 5/13